MKIVRWIEHFAPVISKFGLIDGPKVAKALAKPVEGEELISVNIRQAKRPVYVRLGTSDVSNFYENFVHTEFRLPENINPKLIIDAGANVGYAALHLMNKFNGVKTISIEPDESNFKVLQMNCGGYEKFEGICSAIWVNDGLVKISNPDSGKTGFRVEQVEENDPDGFPAVTIESVLANSGEDRIGILKLDVEGTEKELFEENYKSWIDKVDVLIIELHDRFKPGCALSFYSVIDHHNFVQYAKGDNLVYVNKDLMAEA